MSKVGNDSKISLPSWATGKSMLKSSTKSLEQPETLPGAQSTDTAGSWSNKLKPTKSHEEKKVEEPSVESSNVYAIQLKSTKTEDSMEKTELKQAASWGPVKTAGSKETTKKEEPLPEKDVKTVWGNLKSTGNRDAVLAGKDVKDRNAGLVASKTATSWKAPNELKKASKPDARSSFANSRGAASEMNAGWAKPSQLKPATKRATSETAPERKSWTSTVKGAFNLKQANKEPASERKSWTSTAKGALNLKQTNKEKEEEPKLAEESRPSWKGLRQLKSASNVVGAVLEEEPASQWKATTQLRSTGNMDVMLSGKDVKSQTDENKPTGFDPSKLKSTGKKEEVLAGKDIKPEDPETRRAMMKQGTSWRAPDQLKSTGKKEEVLAGKDIKPEDPETRKAMMKQGTSWRAPDQLKSTGNRDAVLAGKDKISESTTFKEIAKPSFAGFKLKTVAP